MLKREEGTFAVWPVSLLNSICQNCDGELTFLGSRHPKYRLASA